MTKWFVTSAPEDYARPWLFPTLGMLGREWSPVCLFERGDARPVTNNARRVERSGDRFYQDGRFLDALPSACDDDLVVLADADAVLQRPFDASEEHLFDSLGPAQLCAGPNMRPGQRGAEELLVLRTCVPVEAVAAELRVTVDDLAGAEMHNWGLVVGRVSAWMNLRERYRELVGGADPSKLFVNASWMQYLLCLACAKNRIDVVPMPYGVHSHHHFGFPSKDHYVRHRRLWYADKLVAFAHFWPGVTH